MSTILVIDDDLSVRGNLVEILELAGYNVIVAEDGKKGLLMAETRRPDLILCDLSVPILDGYVVLQMLSRNEACCRIPFIFLTSRTDRAGIRMAMDLGADDCITKPFNPSDLLSSIECRLRKVTSRRLPQIGDMKKMMLIIGNSTDRREVPLQEFVKDRNVKFFKKKQIIYREGNYPSCFYYILKGMVKIYVFDEDGKELITELCVEGDFLGFTALLYQQRYTDNAETIGEVQLAIIPYDDFQELLGVDNNFRNQIIKLLAHDIEEKEQHLLKSAYDSLRKKTADALLTVFNKNIQSGQVDAGIKFSRSNLAALAGVAKESLARTLAEFRDEHLIDIRSGTIYILDMGKITKMCK